MRLLVFGGRYYSDRSAAFWALDQVHAASPVTCVIHGGARGADALGDSWAHARGIYTERVRAEWETHGRRAGMLRNARMLAEFAPAYAAVVPPTCTRGSSRLGCLCGYRGALTEAAKAAVFSAEPRLLPNQYPRICCAALLT